MPSLSTLDAFFRNAKSATRTAKRTINGKPVTFRLPKGAPVAETLKDFARLARELSADGARTRDDDGVQLGDRVSKETGEDVERAILALGDSATDAPAAPPAPGITADVAAAGLMGAPAAPENVPTTAAQTTESSRPARRRN